MTRTRILPFIYLGNSRKDRGWVLDCSRRPVTTPHTNFIFDDPEDADGAPHQRPLESVASYPIYADVRLHIPMTHNVDRHVRCSRHECHQQQQIQPRTGRVVNTPAVVLYPSSGGDALLEGILIGKKITTRYVRLLFDPL